MSRFRRASRFDVMLHIAQITTLQSLHYVTISLFATTASIYAGMPSDIGLLFGYNAVSLEQPTGLLMMVGEAATSALGGYYLLLIVERSRLCLDFSCTLYLLHLVICIFHNASLPPLLWLIQLVACTATMYHCSRWLCMRRELKPISIRGVSAGDEGEITPVGESTARKGRGTGEEFQMELMGEGSRG